MDIVKKIEQQTKRREELRQEIESTINDLQEVFKDDQEALDELQEIKASLRRGPKSNKTNTIRPDHFGGQV